MLRPSVPERVCNELTKAGIVKHVRPLRLSSRLNLLIVSSITLLGCATTPTLTASSTPTPTPKPSASGTPTPTSSPTPSPSPTPTPGASGAIGIDNPGSTPHPGIAPANSVVINPGDDVQSIVNAHLAGTNFLFNAGTYSGLDISPKDNDGFYGVAGTVFDGNGIPQAFHGQGNGSGVIISGIIFQNYSPAWHTIGIFGSDASVTDWVIKNNEIRNMHVGEVITAGTRMRIRNNYIHDNYGQGISGYQVDGVRIDRNEIVRNNLANNSPVGSTAEGSGMKFFQTTNTHVTNNVINANNGVGVWFDTDNTGSLISNNIITNNTFTAIMDEISCGDIISNNTMRGNGLIEGTFISGGIFVSTSSNVQIFNNLMSNNLNGVGAFEESRGSSTMCGTYVTTRLKVHDNYVTMTQGLHGMQSGVQSDPTNVFSKNHNCLSGSASFLFDTYVSQATWVAHGQDTTGTFDCSYPGL